MEINIKIFSILREATGASEGTMEIEGNTVGNVVDALVTQYGDKFNHEIFQPDGTIKPGIKLLLNGSFVDSASPLQDTVSEGDTLSFLPAMFGG